MEHALENIDLDSLFQSMSTDENGHVFRAGWHIAWTWAPGGSSVDFLTEHRMTDISAHTFSVDGDGNYAATTTIETLSSFYLSSDDPAEDARLSSENASNNRRIYEDLRRRELLPPIGNNLGSQDMNELLSTNALDEDE